jgi:hypothetical protein
MPLRIALTLILALPVGACAGDSGSGHKPADGAAQIAAWQDAARSFGTEFQGCGRRIYPTRHFFRACMKGAMSDYDGAAAALRRACHGSQLNAAVAAVGSLQRREVRLSDAANDAFLSHRRYRGPGPPAVESRSRRAIDAQLAAARRLGPAACTGR